MIKTRQELEECLRRDAENFKEVAFKPWLAQRLSRLKLSPISDQYYIWKYIKHLRYCEYFKNKARSGEVKGALRKAYINLMHAYHAMQLRRCSYKTGFQIPPNTIGMGLTVWHWGAIIVNPATRIGENCTLYPGVLIGHKTPGCPAPRIGDNCFIASGAKIIGDITIGDNVVIAPNAVVAHDVPSNVLVGGVPAKVIKELRK